jgi:histidyl-tRNA synthetase
MKNKKIKPSILPGFMELLPKQQIMFDDLVAKIKDVYEQNGCMPMDTPIIEKSDVLLAKSGGETEKQVYRFLKGKNDLAMRFDLTVPLARYVAQYYSELSFPFKRYQIGKVYRGEKPQRGRYRELYQCDVDVIGNGNLSVDNDAWIISLADQAFKAIGLDDYVFQISNRKLLKGLVLEYEIECETELMIWIDKYDKIGLDVFEAEVKNLLGQKLYDKVNKFMEINGTPQDVIDKLEDLDIGQEIFREGLDELKRVNKLIKIFGVNENNYLLNLRIIRGLDYYTGTVFETLLTDNEVYGSICSGGRYDNLAEKYTKSVLPGVGISIGLTRLFFVLSEIGFFEEDAEDRGLEYLILFEGDTLEFAGEIWRKLQSEGFRSCLYFEKQSLKKKMTYANKIGVKKIIFVDENMMNEGEFKIKDMLTGVETIQSFING